MRIQKEFNDDVNVIMPQLVNDVTQGAKDGACFWDFELQNTKVNSLVLARRVGDVLPWIKEQKWFNGTAHFFGFSQGGRVGLFINTIGKTRGFFKSATLVWPNCLPRYRPPTLLEAHTPTRIYSTENDPLSQPKNCPSFYSNPYLIELKLYPGEMHSWATHPSNPPMKTFWTSYQINVTQQYVTQYADDMWSTWAIWAICMEQEGSCKQVN